MTTHKPNSSISHIERDMTIYVLNQDKELSPERREELLKFLRGSLDAKPLECISYLEHCLNEAKRKSHQVLFGVPPYQLTQYIAHRITTLENSPLSKDVL